MTKSSSCKSTLKNVVSAADRAVLEEQYEFVPSQTNDDDNNNKQPSTWQDRMVQRYNEGLYREYSLADLSRPGQLGLRWRTRQEVIDGRGERTCGNKRCLHSVGLVTIEVPFAYQEGGIKKKELVKLKLCPSCLPLVRPKAAEKATENEDDGSSRSSTSSSSSEEESSSRERRKRRKHKKKSKHRQKKRRKSIGSPG